MPTEPEQRIVVAGATGRLGAVVDVVLARGQSVRAISRNPESPAADRLRKVGADVVYGDFDDPASIRDAAVGAQAMFATGTAHKAGPEGEARHGRNIADAAAAAGVAHLVYSSGDGAAPDSPLPLFRAKYNVEQHIRALGIRHTILAPVYFMENLFNPWNLAALTAGEFPTPIPVEMPLQQVAMADLLQVAALAIEQPEEFAGQRIPIASDELNAMDAARFVSVVVGRDLHAEQSRPDSVGPGLRALFGWLERIGHHVDIGDLRSRYPSIRWHGYDTWARTQASRFRELCPREHANAPAG
jgi:uncharacterized protein YbjT (DUF2867 family)